MKFITSAFILLSISSDIFASPQQITIESIESSFSNFEQYDHRQAAYKIKVVQEFYDGEKRASTGVILISGDGSYLYKDNETLAGLNSKYSFLATKPTDDLSYVLRKCILNHSPNDFLDCSEGPLKSRALIFTPRSTYNSGLSLKGLFSYKSQRGQMIILSQNSGSDGVSKLKCEMRVSGISNTSIDFALDRRIDLLPLVFSRRTEYQKNILQTEKREYNYSEGYVSRAIHETVMEHAGKSQRQAVEFDYEKIAYLDDRDVFTLTHYGLPEPEGIVWEKPTPNYVWFIAIGVVFVVLAILFGWLRRRSAWRATAGVTA